MARRWLRSALANLPRQTHPRNRQDSDLTLTNMGVRLPRGVYTPLARIIPHIYEHHFQDRSWQQRCHWRATSCWALLCKIPTRCAQLHIRLWSPVLGRKACRGPGHDKGEPQGECRPSTPIWNTQTVGALFLAVPNLIARLRTHIGGCHERASHVRERSLSPSLVLWARPSLPLATMGRSRCSPCSAPLACAAGAPKTTCAKHACTTPLWHP